MRRRTQRRSIPEGYPHSPGENTILKRKLETELHRLDPKKTIRSKLEQMKIGASGSGDVKPDVDYRKVKTLLKKRNKEENLEGASEAKLHEVWQPTFNISERWRLFVCAPITLFYANVLVTNAVTASFTVW